jgi:acyl-coenzyme A thioesterase PaaI-like protein
MDYEALRGAMQVAVPHNTHLGLEVVDVAEGAAVVRLPDDERLRNHSGSQHASALFSAGEAASGGAVVGVFAEEIGDLDLLAVRAEVAYQAIALGPIDARSRLLEDADGLRARLRADGRVLFPVAVTLTNGAGTPVAEMTVEWDVRRREED